MSEIFHFEGFSYVAGNLKVEINFNRFEEQFTRAQQWLGDTVLQDCKAYMPIRTGSMQQRSMVLDGGRQINFPGPYARFMYMGLVMVDPVTGSPWARPGAKKVVTDKPLSYSSPTATAKWFETAKAQHGPYWVSEVKRIGGGG